MPNSLAHAAFAGLEETRVDVQSQRNARLEIERRLVTALGEVSRIGRELIQYEIGHPEPEPLAGLIERFGLK